MYSIRNKRGGRGRSSGKGKEKNIIHKSNNKVNQSMLTGIPQADWCKVK